MTGGRGYARPFGPRYDNLRYGEMPDQVGHDVEIARTPRGREWGWRSLRRRRIERVAGTPGSRSARMATTGVRFHRRDERIAAECHGVLAG